MCERVSVKREDIKFNFLKKIIIRIDFDGIEQLELEKAIEQISLILKDEGYTSRRTELCSGFELGINDPVLRGDELPTVQHVNAKKIYVFGKSDCDIKVKISTSFTLIDINKTKYVDCLKHIGLLLRVVNSVKKESGYFRVKRIGLRKINNCIFRDIEKLNDYFKKEYFPLIRYQNCTDIKTMELSDTFSVDDRYNINFKRSIVQGEYNNQKAYQVVLDSDIYLYSEEIISEQEFEIINDYLYSLYINCLTCDFINKLMGEGVDNKEIIGVESNE